MNLSKSRILLAGAIVAATGGAVLALVPFASLSPQPAFAAAGAKSAEASAKGKEEGTILMAQASEAAPSALPGGASSLQESYQDWQVSCVSQGGAKRCSMSQQQADAKSRQRVLAIELSASSAEAASGALVLPFGLSLDAGASVKVDEGAGLDGLRFRTCLPAGCVVPLTFEQDLLTAMRSGTSLKVTATPADGSQAVEFAISLKGFSAALDRTAALAK